MAKCPACGGEMVESEKFNDALDKMISELPRLVRGLPEGVAEQLLAEIMMCSCRDCGLILSYERKEEGTK